MQHSIATEWYSTSEALASPACRCMLLCGQAPPLTSPVLKAWAMPAIRLHWEKPPLMQAFGWTTSTACATSRSRKRLARPSFWPAQEAAQHCETPDRSIGS